LRPQILAMPHSVSRYGQVCNWGLLSARFGTGGKREGHLSAHTQECGPQPIVPKSLLAAFL